MTTRFRNELTMSPKSLSKSIRAQAKHRTRLQRQVLTAAVSGDRKAVDELARRNAWDSLRAVVEWAPQHAREHAGRHLATRRAPEDLVWLAQLLSCPIRGDTAQWIIASFGSASAPYLTDRAGQCWRSDELLALITVADEQPLLASVVPLPIPVPTA